MRLNNPVRIIIIALASWLIGLGVISSVSYLFYGELSMADFLGFGGMFLIASLFVFAALYVPGLFWLRRRLRGCEPAIFFPFASGILLNAPLFILLGVTAGRQMAVSEAILFASGFLAMGLVFGLGFARAYRANVALASSI